MGEWMKGVRYLMGEELSFLSSSFKGPAFLVP